MKKLAFEVAGNFEMPKLKMVGLEKGGNVMLDDNLSVFTPQGKMNLNAGTVRSAEEAELAVLANGESI